MSNNAANVSAGKPKIGGAIFRAPYGTTLPTSAVEELNNAFKNLGYISEDGVSNSNSPSADNVKEWGGATVLTTQTEKTDTFTFKMLESMNPDVQKAVYGDDNVTGTLESSVTVTANAKDQEACCWVIDMELRGGYIRRIVIPNGTVTEVGDINYVGTAAIAYEVTVTAALDESDNSHYEYTQRKPAVTGG